MIVINRYASILLIVTLLFVVSCGGGGGGGGESATLAGQWQVTTTLTTSLCGDTPGTQDDYNIVVSQNGTQITVQEPYGSLTGSVNGDRASWTGQVFNSAFIFWFTITSLDIQFDDVGFSGTFSWERRNDQSGPVTCTGTSSLSGSRPSVPIPAAPTGLTATTLSSTDIQLSWSDNSSNEEGYRIYRVDNFGISTIIDIVGSGVENYTVQNLTPSTLHRFKVTAYSSGGESFSSNIAEATTPSPPSPPLPAPTGFSVSRLGRTNIVLNWTDNSSTETGFKIFRGLSGGSVNALAGTVGTNVTSYLDPLLNPSTTYHYQVRAYSPSGESDPSATSSATTLSEISGSWDLDLALIATSNPPFTTCGFSSYSVSGQATINRPTAFAIGSTTSFGVLTGVMPDDNSIAGLYGNLLIYGRTMTFPPFTLSISPDGSTMEKTNTPFYNASLGCQGISDIVYKRSNIPDSPTNLQASPVSDTEIALTWTNNSTNEGGFRIYSGASSSTIASPVGTVSAGITAFNHTSLNPDTLYYFEVVAYNSTGESIRSNFASARTEVASGSVPNPPTNLVATPVSDTRIVLNWQDNSVDEDRFIVYRGTTRTSLSPVYYPRAGTTTYTDITLSPNTTYFYEVKASNASGESSPASTSASTLPTVANPPNAPSGLTANAISDTEIQLNWTDNSSDELGFRIYSRWGGSGYSVLGELGSNQNSGIAVGLHPNTAHDFKVRAFNGNGESADSNTATETTQNTGGAGTGTFFAEYDNVVVYNTYDDSTANSTYPSGPIGVGHMISDSAAGCGLLSYSTFLFFDVNSVISGKTINSATLRLYPRDLPVQLDTTYDVYPVIQPWNTASITWNNAPGWNMTPMASVNPPVTTYLPLDWDVTQIVQTWASGTLNNYGLAIWDANYSCSVGAAYRVTQFDSADYYDSTDRRPQLIINWQ